MSNEVIRPPDNCLAPAVKFTGERMYVQFSGNCLKQRQNYMQSWKTVNIYIIYDLKSTLNSFDSTLQNCFFVAIELTKNSDIDKYEYSGYGIGFDSKGTFSHPSETTCVNVIIFGADVSSSLHANNKTKDILILGERFSQGLEDTTPYAEKMYSNNFNATKKKFCLNLHFKGDNSYLFVNGTEIIKFKTKDLEIVANPFCLVNIAEDFSSANMKKKLRFMVSLC